MFHKFHVGVSLVAVTLALSCSSRHPHADPRRLSITAENQEKVLTRAIAEADLTPGEKALLRDYLTEVRASAAIGSIKRPPGGTIADVLVARRTVEAEQEARVRAAAARRAEAEAEAAHLQSAIRLTMLDKTYRGGPSSVMALRAVYENRAGKNVQAFSGTIQLSDPNGDVLAILPVHVAEPLAPGRTSEWNAVFTLRDERRAARLREAHLHDLKAEWRATFVGFADGGRLGRPPL